MSRISVHRQAIALFLAGLALSSAACSTAKTSTSAATPSMTGMGGMDMPGMGEPTVPGYADAPGDGTGLSNSVSGYTLASTTDSVPAGAPGTYSFHISGPDGRAVTRYQPYESKLTVFYLVRSDLTNYQRVDSTMRQDGTWNVSLPALTPGSYRAYVTFAAPDSSQGTPLVYVLSRPLTVPGASTAAALPAPTTSTTADGYTLTLSGQLKAARPIPLSISIANGGKPVPYFDRILDGYAHLTAFRVGDMAFARILSTGRNGGSGAPLTALALFPESGTWRLFVQFQQGAQLHTAAFTVDVTAGAP